MDHNGADLHLVIVMRIWPRKMPDLLVFTRIYSLRSPASRRQMTHELAMLSSGRVFAVRYRLAPQNPFPTALLVPLLHIYYCSTLDKITYMMLWLPPTSAFPAIAQALISVLLSYKPSLTFNNRGPIARLGCFGMDEGELYHCQVVLLPTQLVWT